MVSFDPCSLTLPSKKRLSCCCSVEWIFMLKHNLNCLLTNTLDIYFKQK